LSVSREFGKRLDHTQKSVFVDRLLFGNGPWSYLPCSISFPRFAIGAPISCGIFPWICSICAAPFGIEFPHHRRTDIVIPLIMPGPPIIPPVIIPPRDIP
jgi:hypothetical protein